MEYRVVVDHVDFYAHSYNYVRFAHAFAYSACGCILRMPVISRCG